MLEVLAESGEAVGVPELARALEMDKATVYRMLETMVKLGYVARTVRPAKYEPTIKLWQLGQKIIAQRDVPRIVRPILRRVAKSTGETVFLAIPDGLEAVYIDKIDTKHPLRTSTPVGGRVPLYCGSTGKVLLAHLGSDLVDAVARQLRAFTPRTITTKSRLLAEIRAIRECGYAINQDEWTPGISGVAAPIRDGVGQVVASIGVTGPSNRLPLAKLQSLAAVVREAGREASRGLGFDERAVDSLPPVKFTHHRADGDLPVRA